MYLEHVVSYLSGVIDGTGLNLVYPLSTQQPKILSSDAYVLWNGALELVSYRTVPAVLQFSLLVMCVQPTTSVHEPLPKTDL